jgi:hypothetical protein
VPGTARHTQNVGSLSADPTKFHFRAEAWWIPRGCAPVFRNETSFFRRLIWLIPPHLAPTNRDMKTFIVVFVLALLTIAFEVYSDAALMSAEVVHAAPDAVSVAIGHGSKGG